MTNSAPPIAHPFGWTSSVAKADIAAHDLLPLLKVRMIHALLVALLIATQYWLQLASSLSDQPRLLIETFFDLYRANVPYWIIAFAMITVVQTRVPAGRMRTIVLLSSVLLVATLWSLSSAWRPPLIIVELGLATRAGQAADGNWTTMTWLLFAAWYYDSADRAMRSTAAQRQSELVRRGAERWLLELRLGSLQARLDPQVLFDTLDEAGRLYRSQPAAAEQLLEALIGYLRQALPKLRQPQSTLEREVALAQAYLRVLRTRHGEAFEFESAIDPAVADARFPAMVVQPLCDALARPTLAEREPARIRISASREQDSARLDLSAESVRAAPPHERLVEIRHTLLAMFGPVVRLEAAGPTAGTVRISVEVPYEAAPRIDR